MVVSADTLISRSVARMGGVHPSLKEYAIELIKRAYKEGIRVQISSGYRSYTDQAYIYGQGRLSYWFKGKNYGRIKDGNGKQLPIVSKAEPGESIHNYGLAIDYFLVSKDGNNSIWLVNEDWKRVAAIAKELGFEWGGDWNGFKDYPHLQYNQGLTLSQLARGVKPKFPPLQVKEEVRMLDPSSKALKDGIVVALKNARKEGILSSETWEKQAEDGKLPLDDAVALSFLIADGKKRH